MKTPEEVKQDSRRGAEKDLQQGVLGIRIYGLIRSPELLKKAHEEKGVQLVIIAGDNIDSRIAADAEGYNEVMGPEIVKRLGPNYYEEIRQRYEELRKSDANC